jgi:hypothetical protein
MPSSNDFASLQATDILLWALQRKSRSEALEEFVKTFSPRLDPFYISRRMSEMIVAMRLGQVNSELPHTNEVMQKGKEIMAMMKAAQKERYDAFN